MINAFIEIKIDIISLRTNLDSCEIHCGSRSGHGHVPYFFEGTNLFTTSCTDISTWKFQVTLCKALWKVLVKVESILSKIYKNNSLNTDDFPILNDLLCPTGSGDDKNLKFYISAQYSFENKNWKSWYFKIHNSQWHDTNTTEYRFPILGTGSFQGWHRCWWRMLETKCVDGNFEKLVKVLNVSVTNILNLWTLESGINIQKFSPISKFCH